MQTRRRRTRGAGHGKPSRVQYRKSIRRLEQSIRNADAATQAALNAKRMSRRKGMYNNMANTMNVSVNLRRSSRRAVASTALKSIRKRAFEQRQKNMKKVAESFQKVVKNAKAAERTAQVAEKARVNDEMSNLMRKFGL